ncbi:uncharacterized protein LOC143858228 [Tasmannia lanceolata]|uniref:uncharacterized protein LOC143858228 n=1 Tax=Tasmannia lanceolata TaxID=3420 RepID=UPI004063B23C
MAEEEVEAEPKTPISSDHKDTNTDSDEVKNPTQKAKGISTKFSNSSESKRPRLDKLTYNSAAVTGLQMPKTEVTPLVNEEHPSTWNNHQAVNGRAPSVGNIQQPPTMITRQADLPPLEQTKLGAQPFSRNIEVPSTKDMDWSQLPKAKNCMWTTEMDRALVHALLYQAEEGYKIPNGFKDIAYTYAQRIVNECFGLQLTQTQIRNRVKTMKANYRVLTGLINTNGFGWDSDAKRITVTAEVGNTYISAHPETKRFFTARHDLYDEMNEIFGDDFVNGPLRKNNRAQGTPDQEQTYPPCMPSNETDGFPETASQYDYMTNGFSNMEVPQTTSPLEVPHATSPLAEGRRVDRSHAPPATSPMEMGSGGEASRADYSVRRKKRSNGELTKIMKGVATSIAKMASAIEHASGGGYALCDEIMAALKEIDGLESSDFSDIYEHLSTHPIEGRSFLSRGKDLRLLYVTRFVERRSLC